MKTLTRLLSVAVVAAMIFVVTQRAQINATRAEIGRLEGGAEARSAKAATEPPMTAITGEIARLRTANRDIYKLRGEISQAREKRRAFERMEEENAQLREKIADYKANPEAAKPQPPPFSNQGQATPEAAIETTFWSMYQGDIGSLSRVMPIITSEFERMPSAERSNNIVLLRATGATIEKLEITDRRYDSPDEAQISVRITPRAGSPNLFAGREQTTFVLRRTNEIWQIVSQR